MKKADTIRFFEMENGIEAKNLNLRLNDTIRVKPFESPVVVTGFTKTGVKIKNVYSKQTFTIPSETRVIKTNTVYHSIHF